MKLKRLIFILPVLSFLFSSCESDSTPGDSLIKGDIAIVVDSAFTVSGVSKHCPVIKSKSITQLIGKVSVPEYGDLKCSFVTQFMPAAAMEIPDSITSEQVDSMRIRFRFANTGFVGDSLAPQQLTIYPLTKQIPSDINNTFDPTGYYDSQNIFGQKSYTASHLGMSKEVYKGEFNNNGYATWERAIWANLPKTFALQIFNEYRNNPDTFKWPSTFANYFPGIFVDHNFGNGLIVDITDTQMITYYHYNTKITVVENGVSVTKDTVRMDSVTLFRVSPEIISSNNIKLQVSQSISDRINNSEAIIISPAGYNVEIKFPAQDIINKYWESGFNLAVINNLLFSIPVETIKNNHGITPPSYLLMVKSSLLDTYFTENKIPDNLTSFWAAYDSSTSTYNFTSMREYIIDLMKSGREVAEEDYTFTLVPVWITTETSGTYETTTSVTSCNPLISRPAMCKLKLDEAKIKFTYSKQNIKQ